MWLYMVKKNTKTKIDIQETSPYSDIRKTLKDREILIIKTFEDILGREPSSRELSYYKYGEMEEDVIIGEILNGDDHKKILKDAKEKLKLERKVKVLEADKEKMENLINDKAIEYRELGKLLQTKNEEIKKLRETEKNIYNQDLIVKHDSAEKILSEYSFEYDQKNKEPVPTRVSVKQNPDIFDKIRKILKIE